MKKIISFVLVALLLVSAVPTVLATNDYTQGTQVVYTATGSEAYTITVPALLTPGSNGTVTLEGTWAENRIVTVTAEQTVTLTNSIKADDQKVLNVHFDGISEKGSNTGSQTFTEGVFVDDITNALFGTWNGTFYYNVEIANVASEAGCDTLFWDGNTDGLIKVMDGYKVSSADVPNNMLLGCMFITTTIDDGETTAYETEIDSETYDSYVAASYITDDYAMLGPYLIIIHKQNVNIMGTLFEEAGIYLYCSNENGYSEYISYINVPGYTGFPHSDKCGH